MSDDDLENLLSNFNTLKLTHSSSTPQRDSTSSNRVVLGSIQPDLHQLPAEPQAKLVDTKLGEESKENAAVSAAQTAVADPSTEKAATGEVAAGDLFEDIRELDENERWLDRNVVITELDHRENISLVGDIICSVIDGLSLPGEENSVLTVNPPALGETFTQEEENCLNITRDICPSESVVGAAGSVVDTTSSCDNKNPPAPLNTTFDLSKNTKTLNETFNLEDSTAPSDQTRVLNTTFDCHRGSPDRTVVLQEPRASEISAASKLNSTFDLESSAFAQDASKTVISDVTCLETTAVPVDTSKTLNETFELEKSSSCTTGLVEADNTNLVEGSCLPVETPVNPVASPDFLLLENQLKRLSIETPPALPSVQSATAQISEGLSVEAQVLAEQPIEAQEQPENQPIASGVTVEAHLQPIDSDISSEEQSTVDQKPLQEQPIKAQIPDQPIESQLPSEEQPEKQPIAAQVPLEEQPIAAQVPLEEQPIAAQVPTEQPIAAQVSTEQPIAAQVPLEEQPIAAQAPTEQPKAAQAPLEEQPIAAQVPTMAEEEEIPIPRGTYTINWDEIDEFADPFAMSKPKGSTGGLANSPPIRANAAPPKFDFAGEESPVPAAASSSAVEPEATPTSADTDNTANSSQPSEEQKVKKKSPLKKKKVPAKGGSSKLAEFKKKQAEKLKSASPDSDVVVAADVLPAESQDDPLPPPAAYNFEDCDDPFGTKSKVSLSPVKTTPPTAFADSPIDQAFNEDDVDPFKPRKTLMANSPPASPTQQAPVSPTQQAPATSTQQAPVTSTQQAPASLTQQPPVSVSPQNLHSMSPFMTSAELSSPDALKVIAAKKEKASPRQQESPVTDELSAPTTTSPSHDDFEDAVDELPQEFVPAVPELFNTTADLGVLDRAISAQPSFRDQALMRQSLYRKFDPLVGADVSSPAQQPVSKPLDESLCLMGQGDSPVAAGRQLPVDQLLDITVAPTTPHSPTKYSQNAMDQMKLGYEDRLLEKDKKIKALEEQLASAQTCAAELDQMLNSLSVTSEEKKKTLDESVARLTDERDTYAEGLHQVETSFTELHKRYDQMRQLMVTVRQREGSLTQHNQELQTKILEHSAKFQEIKAEFQSKLSRSYEETQRLKTDHQNQVTKLQMANRKQELTISSQQNQLSQKEGEVRELTTICDNLLQIKQGGDN